MPDAQPLFAGYRNVPWLARTHAVTVVPSASALVTLRRLPPGSPARDKLIGFGDPYFNAQEAAEAERSRPRRRRSRRHRERRDRGDSARAACRSSCAPSPHTEDVDTAELADAAAPARHARWN